jgi:hypothetical protein
MSDLAVGAYFMHLWSERDANGLAKKELNHTAAKTLTVDFVDFMAMGKFCTQWLEIPFVSIGSIVWSLIDITKASLATQSRQLAVQDAIAKAGDLAIAVGRLHTRAVEIGQFEVPPGTELRLPGDFETGAGNQVAVLSDGQASGESQLLSFAPEVCEVTCSVRVTSVPV